MNSGANRIYVAGPSRHGRVGNRPATALAKDCPRIASSHGRAPNSILRTRRAFDRFSRRNASTRSTLAAARVGGIHANNTRPTEFIYENLIIEANVIDAAFRSGVKKLLFLGSSCIYPRLALQPMREDALLTGPLEPTNEPYAHCENRRHSSFVKAITVNTGKVTMSTTAASCRPISMARATTTIWKTAMLFRL